MPTEKLYWEDPFAVSFRAEHATVSEHLGRPSIVLERTLFYPEAGGQLADIGEFVFGDTRVRVDDVQIDDQGTIHHFVSQPEPETQTQTLADLVARLTANPAPVEGAIALDRRLDHMAQHTAQHMISRALVDIAGAETISARLGATSCTIDTQVATLADRDIYEVEDVTNAVIRSDVVVRQHFPDNKALAAMPLRRPPKVTNGIRVIEIESFDFSPCGGTHCTRTGQIGAVRVTGIERYKGGTRVTFAAAHRAIEDSRAKEAVLQSLARDFTCGILDLPNAVAKLRGELKARSDSMGVLRGELVELIGERYWATLPPVVPSKDMVVIVVRERADLAMLRALAGRLANRPDVVAVCAGHDSAGEDFAVVVQRGSAAAFDCGKWLKEFAASHGGRGGGRPERAEGRVGKNAPWSEVGTLLAI